MLLAIPHNVLMISTDEYFIHNQVSFCAIGVSCKGSVSSLGFSCFLIDLSGKEGVGSRD